MGTEHRVGQGVRWRRKKGRRPIVLVLVSRKVTTEE